MSRVVVDLAALADLVDRVTRLQDQVARACQDADARARGLRGTWSGAAAASYETAHAQWRAGASEAADALAVLRSIASTAHENYLAAIAANHRMWTW